MTHMIPTFFKVTNWKEGVRSPNDADSLPVFYVAKQSSLFLFSRYKGISQLIVTFRYTFRVTILYQLNDASLNMRFSKRIVSIKLHLNGDLKCVRIACTMRSNIQACVSTFFTKLVKKSLVLKRH